MTQNKITLRKEQISLLEKLSVVMERKGMQPAMSKVVGLLLVNDEPELTFEQIMDTLELSKGATSQAINQLLTLHKIEYRTRIGDRKRYFCSRVTSWSDELMASITDLSQLALLLEKVLEQRPAHTKEFNRSLKKLIAFLRFLSHEVPGLYKKFEESYN